MQQCICIYLEKICLYVSLYEHINKIKTIKKKRKEVVVMSLNVLRCKGAERKAFPEPGEFLLFGSFPAYTAKRIYYI